MVSNPNPLLERHVEMVRAEYRDMPGLRLTLTQAARLFGLSLETSAHVLDQLAEAGFVVRDSNGAYRRDS
jgi:DNA-binding IclR family transcriptional regulator